MLPFIIVGGLIGVLISALSRETQKEITEFSQKDILTDKAKFFKSSEETKAKIHITKTMNKLIENAKNFKVGKTGSPSDRNKQHTEFKKMYVIVESDKKDFIEDLECIYNEKYITNKKNKNLKIGSAGTMTDKKGRYFLYFVANEK
jgi:hypothetical protein